MLKNKSARNVISAHILKIMLLSILTLQFFCSMADARFISPDTMDPTSPGVGTNRYA